MSRFPLLIRTLVALVIAVVGAPSAGAAVAVRGASSCNSDSVYPSISSTLTLSLARPTGLQAGDLMIATFSGYASLSSPPTGWTATAAATSTSGTWWKIAGASEPSSYSWYATKDIVHNVAISGVITAFSGVDPASPIQVTTQSTGSAQNLTLPAATATRPGSMRVSTVTSAAAVTSDFTPMTEACDKSAGSTAAALAYEPVGVGAVPSRTDNRSGSGSYTAQTIVLNPDVSCGGGSLAIGTPTTVAFPSTTITGVDQQQTATATLQVDDERGSAAGWNVAATSTPLTNGAATLPANAVTVTSAAAAAGAGNCVPPLNAVTYPVQLPAGLPAPTAVKLFNAAVASGTGPVDVLLGMRLSIPANVRVGTYTSTWTFTLQSGP